MVGENLPTPHVPNVGLTIYVDAVNGDDNNTGLSVEQAFKSLHRAYTYLNSQATWPTNQDVRVYIRQGDYTRDSVESTVELSFNNASRQPNANRWIIWQRYPGDARPRILFPTGTSPTNHKLMFKVITSGSWVGDYQMFIGLELSGQSTRINAPGDAVGMYLNGASNIHVVDCRIHGIYAMNTGGSPTSKAQGIYADTGSNNLFYRCTFYDIGSTSGTINIQEHALYIGGHDNAVIACEIFDCWNGYGIQFYRGGSEIDGSIVCSNTIVGTIEKSCMVVPGHASDTVIKNNILVGADQWGIEFYPTTFTGSGNVISHCIYNGHGVANRSSDSPSGWSISNEQTADPLFTDVNNHDFTLQVNSPAIGFADDAWASPVDKFGFTRDNDPDCGAFEFEQVVDDATVQPDSIGAAAGVPAPTVDDGERVALTEELIDDFSGTTIDSNKWPEVRGGVSQNDRLIIPINADYSGFIRSAANWQLAGSYIAWENVHLPSVGNGSKECFAEFSRNFGADVLWVKLAGEDLFLGHRPSGGSTTYGNGGSVTSTTARYVRMRDAGTAVVLEISADGNNWTQHDSLPRPSWLDNTTAGNVAFWAGHWGSESSDLTWEIDNLNLVEPTVQPDSVGAAAGVPAPTVDAASLGQHLPPLHEPDVGLTIYVDAVNGNDTNSGLSVGQPFQTLARAQSYLQNQATWPNNQDVRVYIRQGTYQAASTAAATLDTAFNNTARRPNANRWVIWERYPGDARPKIVPPDGTNSAKMAIRTISSGSTWVGHYQQFRGLEIDGLQQRRSNGDVVGIYISGGNSTTGPVEIVDCVIHGLYANGTGSTGKAQGVFLDSATITVPHKIVGCHIYDVGTTTQTINIQEHGIYTSAYGTKIYGNVIHDCPNGYGIQVYRSNNPVNDVLIASNTITGTLEKSCIIVPPNSTGTIIKNNILRGADQWGIEFYPPGGSGTSCVATHNLFHDNGVAARSETPSGWTISDEINGDPLFFNYTARDFRLQDNSPAIDTADIGFATVVDFLGYQRQDDPDIGAIERNVTEVVVEVPSVGAAAGVDAATVTPVAQPQPDAVGATSNVTGTASAGSTVVASAIAALTTVPFVTFDGNSNAVDKGVGVAAGVPTPLVRTSHTATPSSVGVAGDVPTPDDIIATSLAGVRERWTIVSHVSQSTPKAPSASIGSAADRAWVLRVLPLPVAATVAAVAGVRATAGVSGTASASSTVSPASIGALSALISHIPRGGAGALVGSVGSVVGVPRPVVVGGGALVQAQAIGVVAIVPRPSTVQKLTVAAVASVAALAFVDRPDRVRARRGVRFAPVTRDETDRIRDRKLGSVLLNMATQRARGVGRDG